MTTQSKNAPRPPGTPLPIDRMAVLVGRLAQGPLPRGEKATLARAWGVPQVQVARAIRDARVLVEACRQSHPARLRACDLLNEVADLTRQMDRETLDPKLSLKEKHARIRFGVASCAIKIKAAQTLDKLSRGRG